MQGIDVLGNLQARRRRTLALKLAGWSCRGKQKDEGGELLFFVCLSTKTATTHNGGDNQPRSVQCDAFLGGRKIESVEDHGGECQVSCRLECAVGVAALRSYRSMLCRGEGDSLCRVGTKAKMEATTQNIARVRRHVIGVRDWCFYLYVCLLCCVVFCDICYTEFSGRMSLSVP